MKKVEIDKTVYEIDCDKVIFEKKYYPRKDSNLGHIKQCEANIDKLKPVILTKNKRLVDGFHRLSAHINADRKTIKYRILDIKDEDIFEYALLLNARNAQAMSLEDKRMCFRRLYDKYDIGNLDANERAEKYKYFKSIIALNITTIRGYARSYDDTLKLKKKKEEEAKAKRDAQIYKAVKKEGKSQKEVATEVGLAPQTISDIVKKVEEKTGNEKFLATGVNDEDDEEEIIEFSVDEKFRDTADPFNVWYWERDNTAKSYKWGVVDPRIVKHILYYFTEEEDLVVDVMAGRGGTRVVCEEMNRKWLMYDRDRINAHVLIHDAITKLPEAAQDCDHIYWDPPYYNIMVKDAYKDKAEFLKFIKDVAKNCKESLKVGGKLSFVMCNMMKGKEPTFLVPDCYNIFIELGLKCVGWIQAPLYPQIGSHMGPAIVRARKNKKLLGRDRVVMVFEKVED